MKWIRWLTAGVLVAITGSLVLTKGAADPAADPRIQSVVQRYFSGIRNHDRQLLTEVTNESARFLTVATHGELLELHRSAWLTFLSRPDPATRESPQLAIVSVDRSGSAALVKTRTTLPGVERITYLSLLEIEGEWKIVNAIWYEQGSSRANALVDQPSVPHPVLR